MARLVLTYGAGSTRKILRDFSDDRMRGMQRHDGTSGQIRSEKPALGKFDMIEKAREDHLDSVMDIWLSTNIAAHPFIPQAYWEGVFAQVKEAMPASDIFVYHENDQVLGFIGITGNEYIAGLFVGGKAQSQGIGRKLLSHCKRLYPSLELDVFTENTGAVRFYEANGFEIIGTKTSPDFNREEHRMVWSA